MAAITRCGWAGTDELYVQYHDEEWGLPLHDDRRLFEMLILEGAQAGLSWSTILHKRKAFRQAFDNFELLKVARYGKRKIAELMRNATIIRNRAKIEAAIGNAQAFLTVQEEYGDFDRYIWQFVGGEPRPNKWKSLKNIPAETKESQAMSKDLKAKGFRFVGPTICYAFMQATGMVNDHILTCFRHSEIDGLK